MKEQAVNPYFDYNATTPVLPEARQALVAALESAWHNPSSLYPAAGRARRLLEEARASLARHLGVEDSNRLVFTSGATEANNLLVRHIAAMHPGSRILVSEIEHPSILVPGSRLFPDHMTRIPVNQTGALDLEAFASRLEDSHPCLVSVMAANNETGVLQPWRELNALCRNQGVAFHCDATQWIGKLESTGFGACDWLSGSAHKFGGPKGIGFLVVPSGLERLQGAPAGGPQEHGLRAGTENYPSVAAMLTALECSQQLALRSKEVAGDRDAFEADVLRLLPGTRLCGAGAHRLWNTSMLVVPAHRNLKWLTRLGDLGFSLSTGSACSSGKGNPSHVMQAMGLDFDQMSRVLRISAGWETSRRDWQALLQAFEEVHHSLNSRLERHARSNTISLTDINPLH